MMPGDGTLVEKITRIHAERARNATSAQELGTTLATVGAALSSLERIRVDLLQRIDDEKIREPLLSLAAPLQELRDRTAKEQVALEKSLVRLRRPTLNIGMVGRARQGKSTFLQSLTGLTSEQIPDGSGQFCTGVPSLIQHVPGGIIYADVYFHSEASFLANVIGPYYDRLPIGGAPSSVAEFASAALPSLTENPSPEVIATYGHLEMYHKTIRQYRDLIGAPSPRRIGPREIRSYVAQDDQAGTRTFQAFRAVRAVNIYTQFPRAELGGIGVIDLPGLGDTNLGDSRVLLSALQDDVDLVLFLRRPNADGDAIQEFDIDLYAKARQALPEIPMDRRSFFILNHRRSEDPKLDNMRMCGEFASALDASSAIRVVGVDIADCSSPEEADRAFGPVVDYLVTNIGELDRMLLSERIRGVAEIRREAQLLVSRADQLKALARPLGAELNQFDRLFALTYRRLSVGIRALEGQYRSRQNEKNLALEKAIETALNLGNQERDIPGEQAIEEEFATHDTAEGAYGESLLPQVRTHLSRRFLDLDGALRETVEQMRRDVAKVLKESGRLAPLADAEGREFLSALVKRVPEDGDRPEIKTALQMIIDFDLSYRGLIQHRIRPQLNKLYANTTDMKFPDLASGPRPDAKTVREMLVILYEEALNGCRGVLADLLSEPNQAMFAITEEFRELMLRTRDVDVAWEVEEAWRAFYREYRAEIWPGEFAALAENAANLRAWNEALQRLTSAVGGAELSVSDER
jgi:hypothetical protein